MATIRKRSGKWQVQIRRNNSKAVSRTFHKKSDAEEWARHMEVQADRHDLVPSREAMAQYKVSDILTRYQTEITPKKKGRVQETAIINFLLRQSFANLSLDLLNENQICRFRDERLEQVKPATFIRELAVLRHALEIAKKEWAIPLRNNPAKDVKKPRVINARNRRLEKEESNSLLTATKNCRNPYIKPIIQFALETGMRLSEILNMQWEHLDLQKNVLCIPYSKNGHSRTIPISIGAIELLETQRNMASAGRVFPITSESFKQSWKRVLKRTEIQDLHFHDLRHEAISRFFEKGLTIPEVALISGHKDFRMLFRYTHLKAEDIVTKLNK